MYEPKDEHLKRSTYFFKKEMHYNKRLILYSIARSILGGCILFATWKVYQSGSLTSVILLLLSLAIFVWLVRVYNKTQNLKNFNIQLREINENEVKVLEGTPRNGGDRNMDRHHPYATDLDILGNNSLFSLIDRTCCFASEEKLFKILTNPLSDETEILKRQAAIRELAGKIDFRQHFLACGRQKKENSSDAGEILQWLLKQDSKYTTLPFRTISVVLSILSLFFLFAALKNFLPHEYWIISLGINLSFISILTRRRLIPPGINNKFLFIEKYMQLFEMISKESFQNSYLASTKSNCSSAFQEFARLELILGCNRANNFVVRGFFLPDLHIAAAIEKWRRKNKNKVSSWFECIYTFDELISFGSFAYSYPQYNYPSFLRDIFIRAQGLGHPLMTTRNCVTNDFDPHAKTIILTGANMSGKSTFLRSIGVNLVLAYAGAPVFATSFECCVARINTSMRMTDALDEDSSYFYAELKRLAQIIEGLRTGQKMLILLDEVLKGTNSADKLSGSIGLVEEFLNLDCLCIIATHDLEMGKLEIQYPESVKTYCFESELKNDQLSFDYKIKRGIAKNKNATFLMQKMSLIK
jgi:hypothetical protein